MLKINKFIMVMVMAFAFSFPFTGCGYSSDETVNNEYYVNKEKAQDDIHLCALFVAERINDSYYKPWMLSEVALTFLAINREDIARDVLERAHNAALAMNDASYRADGLIEVARVYVKLGDINKAMDILKDVTMITPLTDVYREIIFSQKDKMDKEINDRILLDLEGKIKNQQIESKDKGYAGVVGLFLLMDEPEKAYKTVSLINGEYLKIGALIDIIGDYSQSQDADAIAKNKDVDKLRNELYEKINLVNDEFYKINLLNEYLKILMITGRNREAEVLIAQIELSAEKVKSKNLKSEILSNIASSYIAMGKRENAKKQLNGIKNIDAKVQVLLELAKTENEFGSAELAMAECDGIRSKNKRSGLMAHIAELYVTKGRLDKALSVVQNMNDDYTKPRMLAYMGELYAKENNTTKANELFDEALEITTEITDNFYRSWALAEIAVRYTNAGMKPDAMAMKMIKEIVETTGTSK
ncbi:MAG: hypothetical protein HQL29_05790 [Candidatus Omnitrophica bacterium]|nr:hypothetical protein [Candidatus Omnitrophota bacterium]